MNDGMNYAEYAVHKSAEGNNLIKRILLIVLYIAIPCSIFLNTAVAFVIGAIAIMIDCIVIFLTWPLVSFDYETVASSGAITFSRIRGKNQKKKKLLERRIKEMTAIGPYTAEAKESVKADVTHDFRGSRKSGDSYYALYEDCGKTHVVLFETTNKMMNILAYYNSGTVKIDTLSK